MICLRQCVRFSRSSALALLKTSAVRPRNTALRFHQARLLHCTRALRSDEDKDPKPGSSKTKEVKEEANLFGKEDRKNRAEMEFVKRLEDEAKAKHAAKTEPKKETSDAGPSIQRVEAEGPAEEESVQTKRWKGYSDTKKMYIGIGGAVVVALYVAVVYYEYLKNQRIKAQEKVNMTTGTSYGKPSVGGPFDLIDVDGNRVTSESLKGRWVLLYFGFTMCPDVCPEQMELMGELVDILKDKFGVDMLPVMITIDPERDDPAMLKEYLQDFHPKFVGLTGPVEDLDTVCLSYRVYRSKGQTDDPHDYIMDHTITQYVLNPRGEAVGFFLTNRLIDERVEIMERLMKEYEEQFGDTKAARG